MPIAAKFSEDFYERFGHRATGELVDYLNRVDSDYRSELERLNDANWARLEARIEGFEAKLNARIDRLEAKMEQRFAEMKSEMLKWMFLFWLGTIGIVLGMKL